MIDCEKKLLLRRKRRGEYEKQKVEASLEGFFQNVDSKEKAMMMLLWRIGDKLEELTKSYIVANNLLGNEDIMEE